jgi:DNA replication protein DnaC
VSERYPDGAWQPCACLLSERRRRAAERLLADAGLTLDHLARWQFGTFDPARCVGSVADRRRMQAIIDDLRAYAVAPTGWRVLQGVVGSGKTHLAYAVAAEWARARRPVYVSNVPDLLDSLRRGFDDDTYTERLRTLMRVDLLVLDDLGTESATPFAVEKLYQIIDARYRERLPMVVTTNRLLAEDHALPPRIVSRLLDRELSVVWSLPVADYRRHGHG